MQIVINLSEEDYNCIDDCILGVYGDAIKNGTPLPKGHGRLIDADRLVKKAYKEGLPFVECVQEFSMMLEINAPTVIPAEKDGE